MNKCLTGEISKIGLKADKHYTRSKILLGYRKKLKEQQRKTGQCKGTNGTGW